MVMIAQLCAVPMPTILAPASHRDYADVVACGFKLVVDRDVTRIRVMWEKFPGVAQ